MHARLPVKFGELYLVSAAIRFLNRRGLKELLYTSRKPLAAPRARFARGDTQVPSVTQANTCDHLELRRLVTEAAHSVAT